MLHLISAKYCFTSGTFYFTSGTYCLTFGTFYPTSGTMSNMLYILSYTASHSVHTDTYHCRTKDFPDWARKPHKNEKNGLRGGQCTGTYSLISLRPCGFCDFFIHLYGLFQGGVRSGDDRHDLWDLHVFLVWA